MHIQAFLHHQQTERVLTNSGNLRHGLDSSFWHILATRLVHLSLIVLLLPNVRDRTETDSKANPKKTDADANRAKSMTLPKHQGKSGVEEKAQSVEIPIIQCSKDDDGLRPQKPERSRQCDTEELLDTTLAQMVGHLDVLTTATRLALALGPARQDDAVSSLAAVQERDGHDGPEGAANAEQGPEDVSPAVEVRHKGHHEEAGRRTACCRPQVEGHGRAGVVGMVQVGDGSSEISDGNRGEIARQQADW